VFDSASVIAAFEEATGVPLELERPDNPEEWKRFRASPAGRLLPAVANYASPKDANDRFGGHFLVRLYTDRAAPDRGTEGDGLERLMDDFGDFIVSGSAWRANVTVMFWSDTSERITPTAEATWALLTSCLESLSPSSDSSPERTPPTDRRRSPPKALVPLVGLALFALLARQKRREAEVAEELIASARSSAKVSS
jgi:hypothetical protein